MDPALISPLLYRPRPSGPSSDDFTRAKPHQLCEKCLYITQNPRFLNPPFEDAPEGLYPDEKDSEVFIHHQSTKHLMLAVQGGCHLCTLILDHIHGPVLEKLQELEAEFANDSGSESPLYRIGLIRTGGRLLRWFKSRVWIKFMLPESIQRADERAPDGITARLTVEFESTDNLRLKEGLSVVTGDVLAQDDNLVAQGGKSASTASASSFALAQRWLKECLESHQRCAVANRLVTDTKVPTRLIDVCSGMIGNQCCLYIAEPHDQSLRYLTLSHCWGDAQITKLTRASQDDMLVDIPLNQLPPTFQDAVVITRTLGYRYIWIDSLCIIQDDPDDWRQQSATMSRIYSNSDLTIAALWGRDSQAGCFIERNPLLTQHCLVGQSATNSIYVVPPQRGRGKSIELTEPKPLYKRGWVLQERLLSPRILAYGPRELHWECSTRDCNETKPHGSIGSFLHDTREIKYRLSYFEQVHIPTSGYLYDESYTEAFYDAWADIKDLYWRSALTYHDDRLLAISGITTTMEKRTGMTMLYGLWKEFLAGELLWCVLNPNDTMRSSSFPTWSWASVKGASFEAGYAKIMFSPRCTVQVSFEPDLDNTLLDKTGALQVRGPLMHTVLRRNVHGHLFSEHVRNHDHFCNFYPDTPLPDSCEVWLLQIFRCERAQKVVWGKNAYPRDIGTAGLILLPIEDEESAFRRAGCWALGSQKIHKYIAPAPEFKSFRLL